MPSGNDPQNLPAQSAAMSPQQIMRARYKQQMMPPRTWKQQQARVNEIESLNDARKTQARSAYTAAAAKASAAAAKSVRDPRLRPPDAAHESLLKSNVPTKQSTVARSGAAQATSPAQSINSSSPSPTQKDSPLADYRPQAPRRGSSTSSISRAAAVNIMRSPGSRRSSVAGDTGLEEAQTNDSASSYLSSVSSSSRRGSVVKTTSPVTKNTNNRSDSLGPAGAAAKASAASPISIAPRVPLSRKFVTTLTQALRIQQEQRKDKEVEKSVPEDMLRNLELRKTKNTERPLVAASHGYSADPVVASSPVSSVGHANIASTGRRSTESARSFASNVSQFSGRSRGSGSDHSNNYAITPGSFAELQLQQQQFREQQLQKKLRTAEENKANALQAAVAAGVKVEADMASIHIQVNAAVEAALERRKRGQLMKKYRPAASWSSPGRILKPQLKRLQTADSNKFPTTQNSPADSAFPLDPIIKQEAPMLGSPNPADLHPIKSLDEVTEPLRRKPEKWIGEPPPMMPASPTVPKPGPALTLPFQFSMRSKPRPSHAQKSVSPAQVLKNPASPFGSPTSSVGSAGSASVGKQSGFDIYKANKVASPRDPANESYPFASLFDRPNDLQQPQAQQSIPQPRMLRTLRGGESKKRFNEEKPWKGHRERTELSERERRRYESLWVANRDTHLPYLYVPAQYQKEYDELIAEMLPHLFKSRNQPGSAGSSQPARSKSPSLRSVTSSSPHNPPETRNGNSSSTPALPIARQHLHRRANSKSLALSPANSQRSVRSALSSSSLRSAQESDYDDAHNDAAHTTRIMSNRNNLAVGAHRHSRGQRSMDLKLGADDELQFDFDRDNDIISDEDVSGSDEEVCEEEAEGDVDVYQEIEKRCDEVHGYVVARLWRRSRLPEETLAQIWDLVDTNKDGTLDRTGFTVGMWLCDQCLYGRKLPTKVPPEVWQSAGRLNLKIRVKQKRSKIGYVRRIPKAFGSAVGYTMHGGRQAVKKAIQTATK